MPALLLLLSAIVGCQPAATRRGATVLFASGADLQSINPLLTLHPLARQVQRYVLLTTLARYDSALVPQPYLARAWRWSADRRRLTFHLATDVRWHDGRPTTAGDVRWTLEAARDPVVGYPRAAELAALKRVEAPDDSTVTLDFAAPPAAFPDVLTDLAMLPAHLLDTVPRDRLRQAAWNEAPVGNGPFRFVAHEPNRRWVFAANPDFPAALGGPPRLQRLIIVVVDEPTTKLAALTAGELDFAGIQPAHAQFVARDPRLAVVSYPLLLTYGIALNTRRPPFDALAARRRLDAAVDRRDIVQGYLYGFGTPSTTTGATRPPRLCSGGPRHDRDGTRAPPTPLRAAHGRERRGAARADGSGAASRGGHGRRHPSAGALRLPGPSLRSGPRFRGRRPRRLGRRRVSAYLGSIGTVAGVRLPADPAAAQRIAADSVPMVVLYHARGLQGMNRRVRGVRMDLRGELPTVHDWSVTP